MRRREAVALICGIGVVFCSILCGCGGSGSGTSRTTPVKVDIQWAARSRVLSGPSSSLSAVVTLKQAGTSGGDFSFTVNRLTGPAAYTGSYTSATAARVGTWDLSAQFFAQADGAGSLVGTVAARVTIAGDGSGIPDIATVGTVASVEVPPSQSVNVGETKNLAFIAKGTNGTVLALSPGSAFFNVVTGSDKLGISNGQVQGLAFGSATVTATVDGKSSSAVTVLILDPGGNGLASAIWPKHGKDLAGTAQGTGSGAVGTLKWHVPNSKPIYCGPTIGPDGTVYIGSEDRSVYAFDGSTGRQKWSFLTGNVVYSSPVISGTGTVFVGSDDNKVYAIDAASGQKKWEFVTGSSVIASGTLGTDGTLYIGSFDKKLYALDGRTGQRKWDFLTDGQIWSTPAIGPDGTVYVGSSNRTFYGLDGATGQQRWAAPLTSGIFEGASPAIGANNTIYVPDGSALIALDMQSGQVKWQFTNATYKTFLSPAIGSDGTIYIGSADQKVYALNGQSGVVIWTFTGNGRPTGIALAADGTVYFGSGDRKLHALNHMNGQQLWEFPVLGDMYSDPAIGADGTVYFGTIYDGVYAIR
jgi:outer membrane protein assembly factor BamB